MDSPEQWDPETVDGALGALNDLTLFELTPQRWEQVAETLEQLEQAWVAGDAEDLRDAASDLELIGSVRVVRLGAGTFTGIPAPILERRNTLVHRLSRERGGKADERDARPPR